MKVVIINGASGSGKDTFIELCRKCHKEIGNVSMVSGVKRIAKTAGWDGNKTPKDRKFLSDLKDLLDENFDYSFKYVKSFINDQKRLPFFIQYDTDNLVTFIVARSPKDIGRLKRTFKAHTLCITRKSADTNVGNASNHADRNIFDYDYDEYISNDGTLKELEIKAKDFIERILENGADY